VPETLEPYNLESYCANGPMARTVSDTALMQNVISGAHPTDSGSALPKITLPLEYESSLAGQRIAWSMTPGTQEPEADVMRNTHDSLQRLKALGAEVVEVTLEWPEDIERAYYGHMDPLFFSQMAYSLENHRDLMCDYNIHMVEQALERLKDTAAFYKATCIESEMYRVFGSLMENYDVFVCPTVLSNQLRADFNPAKDDYIVNGVVSEYDLCISNCHLFNMMGRCPAISVPSGIGDNGVPTGLHIASKANDDIAVFRVAAALESSWDQPFRPGMR
jgi:Asp-tRNA(Asn)/Glu-tRNA(Gln) amidotransferase A subunit family amidase